MAQVNRMNAHDGTEGVASYAIGGGAVVLGYLTEIANWAQALAIILGCIIVAIRLCHDAVRFYRYLKSKQP